MITGEEFFRAFKGYGYSWSGNDGLGVSLDLRFTGQEIVAFLEANGYEVIMHKFPAQVTHRTFDGGGGTDHQWQVEQLVEDIVCIKKGDPMPKEFQTGIPKLIPTFFKVLKQKMLNI